MQRRAQASLEYIVMLALSLLVFSTILYITGVLINTSSIQVGVTWRDPVETFSEIGALWGSRNVQWACTSELAASVVAPFLSEVSTFDVYVDRKTILELEVVAADAGLRVLDGGRLNLSPFPTTTCNRMSREVGGLRVVPWPRVYADLRQVGVRGEEAAEHLREVMNA